MKKIELDIDTVKFITRPYNARYSGSEGRLYNYQGDLFKVSHMTKDNLDNNILYEDDYKRRLYTKYNSIDYIDLPYAYIEVNNYIIGSISKKIEGTILSNYYIRRSKIECLKIIKDAILENNILVENGIYNKDLHSGNIILDRKKNAHLLDLDSYYMVLDNYDIKDTYYSLVMYYLSHKRMPKDVLDSIRIDLNSINNYKDYAIYLDELCKSKTMM